MPMISIPQVLSAGFFPSLFVVIFRKEWKSYVVFFLGQRASARKSGKFQTCRFISSYLDSDRSPLNWHNEATSQSPVPKWL